MFHDRSGYMFGKGVYFADVGYRSSHRTTLVIDFR